MGELVNLGIDEYSRIQHTSRIELSFAPRSAPDADDSTKAGGRCPWRDRAIRIDQRVAGHISPSTYPASLMRTVR